MLNFVKKRMKNSSLDSISPIDGRYTSKTEELQKYFSESSLIIVSQRAKRSESMTRYVFSLSDKENLEWFIAAKQ